MLSLDSCTSSCGYAAIFISSLCFGSFSVPMKSEAAKAVDIDPLVFQSYKTLVYLVISLLLILFGQDLTFTPWGIVSGFFWIPAGVFHVLAVRTAGVAIATGACASVVVLVSFAWGILVFNERIRSITETITGIAFMIIGMFGMSYFSSEGSSLSQPNVVKKLGNPKPSQKVISNKLERKPFVNSESNLSELEEAESSMLPLQISSLEEEELGSKTMDETFKGKAKSVVDSTNGSVAMISRLSTHMKNQYDVELSPRFIGITMSLIGGVWGGSVMVPLQFVDGNSVGFNYVFSFAIGSTLINILAWVARFYFIWKWSSRDIRSAYLALPSFHLKSMAVPGVSSGILYCFGNLASIVSVTYLGEGVGYSMTQSALLVSGLWGIFWYREITTPTSIRGWLLSASITLGGMVIVCLNHIPATAPTLLNLEKSV